MVECLGKIKGNLSNTVYENKINALINQILHKDGLNKDNFAGEDIYKKLILQNNLGLDGTKTPKI